MICGVKEGLVFYLDPARRGKVNSGKLPAQLQIAERLASRTESPLACRGHEDLESVVVLILVVHRALGVCVLRLRS
jgi:hypothetical protein